ncbi:MAG: hypothetical protein E5X34_13180 [Mesorhizobium sp.]|uniref:hypothetical protein n=1 Tax=Mesorhizobium sp. TaxID=1871066 RepID=UPI00121BDC69|nr:hypothetical protein [Mesorhizobium sp.]TIR24002.1 MAG: hypothetical protein E5X34_13180 [Mesorhizobium sp.]
MTQIVSMLVGAALPRTNMPRFEYSRMNGTELHETFTELGMPPYGFARIFGVKPDTVKKWLRDQQDIPPWVYVALSLLYVDGALGAARKAAAEHIKFDNKRPAAGEFPYLNGGDLLEGSDDDD